MAYPVGLVTRAFQTVQLIGAGGKPLTGKVAFVPSTSLKWEADGTVILKQLVVFPLVNGVASGLLPIIQSGFVDSNGNEVERFVYTAFVQESEWGQDIPPWAFELDAGVDTFMIDFSIPNDVDGTVIREQVGGGGGGVSDWGDIGGTLSNQTDLQLALNGKQPAGSYQPAGDYATEDFVADEIAAIPSVTTAFLGTLDGEPVKRWAPLPEFGAELWQLSQFFYAYNTTDLTPELIGTGTNQILRTAVPFANISNQDRSWRVHGNVVIAGGAGVYGQCKLRVGLMYSNGSTVPGTNYQLVYDGHAATYPIEFDVSMEKVDAGGVVWLNFQMEMSNGVANGVGSFQLTNMSVKEIAEIQPIMHFANSGESPALYTPSYDAFNRTWKMHRTYMHPTGALNDVLGVNSSRVWRYGPMDPYLIDTEQTSIESEFLYSSTEFERSLRVGNNDQIFIVKKSTGDWELRGNVHGGESVRSPAGTNLKYEYDVKGDGNWLPWDGNGIHLYPARKFRYTYNTQLARSAPDNDVFAHVNHVCTFFPDGVMRMDRTTTFQTNTKLAGHLEWMSSHNLETPALGRIGNGLIMQNEVDVFMKVAKPGQPTLTPATSGGSLPAATYKYVITALADGGETDHSLPQTAVVASGVAGQVTVSWSAVTDAEGYRIYGRSNADVGKLSLLATVGKVTSWIDTGANPPQGIQPPTRNRARRLAVADTATQSVVSGTASWATWYDPIVGLCLGNIYDREALAARPGVSGLRVRLEKAPGIRKNYIDVIMTGDNAEIHPDGQPTQTVLAGTSWTATHWAFCYAPADIAEYHQEIAARAADLSVLKTMYPA